MVSLLDTVTPAAIRTDPFPHIVIDDALPPMLYAAISAAYPSLAMIVPPRGGDRPAYPSNHRYTFSAWISEIHDALPPVWKEFVRQHSGPRFFEQVVRLFDGYWPRALLDHLGGNLLGHSMGLLLQPHETPPRIFLDARAEVNTPVYGAASVVRGPHLDTSNRLFSGLFYLRAAEDDTGGGDLTLYRWKHGPIAAFDTYVLPADSVEAAVTIPYRANRFVLFPQTIQSLHGVAARPPTPHVRRYVFITAELATPWLSLNGDTPQ